MKSTAIVIVACLSSGLSDVLENLWKVKGDAKEVFSKLEHLSLPSELEKQNKMAFKTWATENLKKFGKFLAHKEPCNEPCLKTLEQQARQEAVSLKTPHVLLRLLYAMCIREVIPKTRKHRFLPFSKSTQALKKEASNWDSEIDALNKLIKKHWSPEIEASKWSKTTGKLFDIQRARSLAEIAEILHIDYSEHRDKLTEANFIANVREEHRNVQLTEKELVKLPLAFDRLLKNLEITLNAKLTEDLFNNALRKVAMRLYLLSSQSSDKNEEAKATRLALFLEHYSERMKNFEAICMLNKKLCSANTHPYCDKLSSGCERVHQMQ